MKLTRAQKAALNVLYGPLTPMEKSMAKGVKFGDVTQSAEQHPFITSDELSEYERFTIIGARKMTIRNRHQIFFDIALPVGEGDVEKRCFTVDENPQRLELMQLVINNKYVTGVRLDIVPTNNGNRYYKFSDADSPRVVESSNSQKLDDDDIPF